MFEQFTDRARKIMQLANQEAQRFNHEYIGTEHIFLGIIKEGNGVAANVLKNLSVDLRKARLGVEALVQSGPEMITIGKLPQTPRCKKVLEYSHDERQKLCHSFLGSEHLLLGLLREQEGVAAQVLMNLGLKLDDVREEVLNILGTDPPKNRQSNESRPGKEIPRTVQAHSVNLVEQLQHFPRHIKLDEAVVRRSLISLTRTTANNLFLVGDMYTCEEYLRHFASLLATRQMPAPLANQSLYELRSQGKQSHFNKVCIEAGKFGNIILATDLFTGPIGSDKRLVTQLDSKRYWFSMPSVKFIVCGTAEDWHEILSNWPRVADSFSHVRLPQPGNESIKSIVDFERVHLQIKHSVEFSDEALDAAVKHAPELGGRVDNPNFVRAIEILDFAAARKRLFDSTPLAKEQQSKHDELVYWFNQMHLARKEGKNDAAEKLNEKIKQGQSEFLKSEAARSMPSIGKTDVDAAVAEMKAGAE